MKDFDLFRLNAIFVPLIAGGLGLLVGAVMLLALGANPIDAYDAYAAMLRGAFGSPNAFADTLVKACPLLFVGIGTCIAYRGGEEQIVMGAIAMIALGHDDSANGVRLKRCPL